MKTPLRSACMIIAAMALVLATAGPSRADDLKDDPTLAPATLRLTDLPQGWAIADDTDRDGNGGRLPPLCGVIAPAPTARSVRSFAQGSGTSVTSVVMRFKAGRAKAFLDALALTLRKGCLQIIETGLEENDPIEARYVQFTLPKLGNQVLGLRLAKAEPLASEVVLIRRGDVISVVATGAIFGPALSATPLAKVAAPRLAKIR